MVNHLRSHGIYSKKTVRYPRAVSSISEMSNGNFQEVIDDAMHPL